MTIILVDAHIIQISACNALFGTLEPPYTGYHKKTISARHLIFIRFLMLRRLLLNSRLSLSRNRVAVKRSNFSGRKD